MDGATNEKLDSKQKLYFQQEYDKESRNPSTALMLTLLLGGLGAHRFYLKQWGWGTVYLLFSATFVPMLCALIECFVIRKRVTAYNEQIAAQIKGKMQLIYS